MKRLFCLTGYLLLIVAIAGCASLHKVIQPAARIDTILGAQPFPDYSGPKARIVVADFDVKAAKAGGEVGLGLREMLASALIKSSRFFVLERQTTDLIINTTVTEFEPQASGGKGGIGGGGGAGSGVLGGLLGSALNKSYMALEIRIVDASTLEVLAASRVQAQAADVSGSIMSGLFGSWVLGRGLSAYANTPMEKAIRSCIIEAVRYISKTVPENYYKY